MVIYILLPPMTRPEEADLIVQTIRHNLLDLVGSFRCGFEYASVGFMH